MNSNYEQNLSFSNMNYAIKNGALDFSAVNIYVTIVLSSVI